MARLTLAKDVQAAELAKPKDVVDYFVERFFVVSPPATDLERLAQYLESQLGTADVAATTSYSEEALRATLHLLLSLPEYQLG